MIGIGRFFALPARIGDRSVSLTSRRFRADPFIASGAGNDVTATRTLTVACKHIVSHENDSNFNGIQCKQRLIMFMSCQMRLAQPEWVSVWERQHTQSNSQKFIDAYFGRKKEIFTKYDLNKQHYTAMMFLLISISTRLQCDTDFIFQ